MSFHPTDFDPNYGYPFYPCDTHNYPSIDSTSFDAALDFTSFSLDGFSDGYLGQDSVSTPRTIESNGSTVDGNLAVSQAEHSPPSDPPNLRNSGPGAASPEGTFRCDQPGCEKLQWKHREHLNRHILMYEIPFLIKRLYSYNVQLP